MSWTDQPLIVPDAGEGAFPFFSRPATLHIEAGTGNVQLQRRDSSGDWATFRTLTDADVVLDVANSPALRIIATGNAKFRWTWA